MVAKRFGLAVLAVVTILAVAPLASAQNAGIICTAAQPTCGVGCDTCGQGFWMGFGVRKFINSFTSAEAPRNLNLQEAAGRTKLEWPLDQWYGAVKLGYCRGPVGIVVDYMAALSSGSGIKAQETYWDAQDQSVTLFGKGSANPRGSVFDIAATWALPIPSSKCEDPVCGIAAVVGFRQQGFRYSMTGEYDNDETGRQQPIRYRGETAQFGQYHTHWYVGGILTKAFDPGTLLGGTRCYAQSYPCVLAFQADYAYVRSNNNLADYVHSFYLGVVPGQIDAWQRTTGGCWHLNASLVMDAGNCLKLIVEGDYKRLTSYGQEETSFPLGTATPVIVAGEWRGAKAWSDQAYVGLMAAYGF